MAEEEEIPQLDDGVGPPQKKARLEGEYGLSPPSPVATSITMDALPPAQMDEMEDDEPQGKPRTKRTVTKATMLKWCEKIGHTLQVVAKEGEEYSKPPGFGIMCHACGAHVQHTGKIDRITRHTKNRKHTINLALFTRRGGESVPDSIPATISPEERARELPNDIVGFLARSDLFLLNDPVIQALKSFFDRWNIGKDQFPAIESLQQESLSAAVEQRRREMDEVIDGVAKVQCLVQLFTRSIDGWALCALSMGEKDLFWDLLSRPGGPDPSMAELLGSLSPVRLDGMTGVFVAHPARVMKLQAHDVVAQGVCFNVAIPCMTALAGHAVISVLTAQKEILSVILTLRSLKDVLASHPQFSAELRQAIEGEDCKPVPALLHRPTDLEDLLRCLSNWAQSSSIAALDPSDVEIGLLLRFAEALEFLNANFSTIADLAQRHDEDGWAMTQLNSCLFGSPSRAPWQQGIFVAGSSFTYCILTGVVRSLHTVLEPLSSFLLWTTTTVPAEDGCSIKWLDARLGQLLFLSSEHYLQSESQKTLLRVVFEESLLRCPVPPGKDILELIWDFFCRLSGSAANISRELIDSIPPAARTLAQLARILHPLRFNVQKEPDITGKSSSMPFMATPPQFDPDWEKFEQVRRPTAPLTLSQLQVVQYLLPGREDALRKEWARFATLFRTKAAPSNRPNSSILARRAQTFPLLNSLAAAIGAVRPTLFGRFSAVDGLIGRCEQSIPHDHPSPLDLAHNLLFMIGTAQPGQGPLQPFPAPHAVESPPIPMEEPQGDMGYNLSGALGDPEAPPPPPPAVGDDEELESVIPPYPV